MSEIKYDLTELYDVLQKRRDKAYVCADLGHLMWINENLGREAGDAALLEMMRRIEAECREDDIFLRIGGDEFVVFTNSEDTAHANEIVENVGLHNNGHIRLGDTEIPVQIHIGSFLGFPENVSIGGLFNEIIDRIGIIKEHVYNNPQD
ncbi:MAG: diguanylate cyclase [Roseburia sp.]|nr:diguanylate cyclase [Roseburia sp.]MCM1243823.1 diguanylate cyclase [Roseburia sp.]